MVHNNVVAYLAVILVGLFMHIPKSNLCTGKPIVLLQGPGKRTKAALENKGRS